MELEVLVAAMKQNDTSLHEQMNLKCNTLIANQCSENSVKKENFDGYTVKLISTNTRGVGKNRNTALDHCTGDILLFADDDIVYYDSDLHGVTEAFVKHPDADIIFFGLDYTRDSEVFDRRRCKDERIYLRNALKFGTARTAVRRSAVMEKGIRFSEYFGGGAIYSSGEDSLFIRDCFKVGMTAYSDPYVLGRCAKDSSSWFTGFNEKYLFDKGAWLAAAFPKAKHLIKWYFIYKFSKKAKCSFGKTRKLINNGIRAYSMLETYKG